METLLPGAWKLATAPEDQRLLDVSLSSGYGDYSTFCRRVRDRFGRPPSRWLS